MKFVLIVIACWSMNVLAQTSLVGNQGGEWFIYSDGERIALPDSYYDLGNFDNQGLATFAERGLYGVLSTDGTVVAAAHFRSIKPLGGGLFVCIDSGGQRVVDYTAKQPEGYSCREAKPLTRNWYRVDTKVPYLFNPTTRTRIDLNENMEIIRSDFGYVYLRDTSALKLYDPAGDSVWLKNRIPRYYTNYLDISAVDKRIICFADHQITLPAESKYVRISDDEIVYSHEGRSFILNPTDGEVLFAVNYDKITPFDANHYLVYKDRKAGVMKKNGELVFAPKYNYISDSKTYYTVYDDDGTGAIKKSGETIIPCAYDRITATPDFFTLYTDLGFQGLFSRKVNKLIVECMYDGISIRDNKIRARSGDNLRIIEIDSMHNVVNTVTLANTVTVKMVEFEESDELIDARLYSLGWFKEDVPKYDSLGFKIGVTHKWGLKGANDSIIKKASNPQPLYIPNAEFSLVPRPKGKASYGGVKMEIGGFTATNYTHGRMLTSEAIFSIDTADLFTRSYSRFVGAKGPGIIQEDGQIEHVDFIDGDDTEFVRFCKSKSVSIQPSDEYDPFGLRMPNLNLNDDPSICIDYTLMNKRHSHIRFENTKWNFLDIAGQKLFGEDFDFAMPFHRKTAVVQKDGKWGVVSQDSVVIPFRFNMVKRISDITDTVFLVQRIPGGIRYIDSLTKELPEISRYIKRDGPNSQVQIGNEKRLMNAHYEFISGDSKSQRLMDNGYFYARNSKDFEVYDSMGVLVASSQVKPIDVIASNYLSLKGRGKLGLVDFMGDTLLDFTYRSIEGYGPFIVAGDGFEFELYNDQMELLRKLKSGQVLYDPVSQKLAVIETTRCLVFDAKGQQVAKFKNFYPTIFHNGTLLETGKGVRGETLAGTTEQFKYDIKEIEVMDNFGFLIEDRDKQYHFVTPTLNEILPDSTFTRAKYAGEGFVIANTSEGSMIFSAEKKRWSSDTQLAYGQFNNGLLLAGERYTKKWFLNTDLEVEFSREFADAQPFDGDYASIKGHGGWTIIDRNGLPKSLPAYEEIKPLGNNLFSTRKQPLFGLYDSHGKMLIPVEFQLLTIIHKDLIQGVKEGEIFYFHLDGTPIELK